MRVLPGPDDVARAVADEFVARAERAIGEHGVFRVALAGGSTPKLAYRRLAEPELARLVDWSRCQVFFGDERSVSPDDDRSNFKMANDALLSRVPIPEGHVHRVKGELSADEAALLYEQELGDEPLDLVLLGMGDDGHTLSLFPGRPELDEAERRVVPGTAPVEPRARVSLTLRTVSEAHCDLFVVTGGGKAARVAEVLREIAADEPTFPAARIRPKSGELIFHLDEPAAATLHAD